MLFVSFVPIYAMVRFIVPDVIIEKGSTLFNDADINDLDGIKFTWDEKGVHLRRSNTEPILRIYAEAPNKDQALELISKTKSII